MLQVWKFFTNFYLSSNDRKYQFGVLHKTSSRLVYFNITSLGILLIEHLSQSLLVLFSCSLSFFSPLIFVSYLFNLIFTLYIYASDLRSFLVLVVTLFWDGIDGDHSIKMAPGLQDLEPENRWPRFQDFPSICKSEITEAILKVWKWEPP